MKKSGLTTQAPPLDLAQQNVETIARLEEAALAQHSRLDRLIDAATRFIGSVPFVCLHLAWFTLWAALKQATEPEKLMEQIEVQA